MVKAIQDAGFPPGVVNLIQHRPEDAQEINTTMIAHPAIRKVTFTGSTRVGSIIAATAAQNLKPALMELGGKCPLIILEDADLEAAAQAAIIGAFDNVGRSSTLLENANCSRRVRFVCLQRE
jgi:acyl-CoA reductase-like NAD-dependent aldehyde dehydrogenase